MGNGILSNSTLNLHGSSLLEQIAHIAADSVASPLAHNHSCHRRTIAPSSPSPNLNSNHDESHHNHNRKRQDTNNDEQSSELICEEHKLLDEWNRASRNRCNPNETYNIVQDIDTDSTAALFQLTYGIPSLLIEMTDEQVNLFFFYKKSTKHTNK